MPGVALTGVPVGAGWDRLAEAVAAEVPVGEVQAVWTFPAIRREGREWGTAIVARASAGRLRIYTARYMHQLKGKERGRYAAEVTEVGAGPLDTVEQLLAEARERLDDEGTLAPVPVDQWFAAALAAAGDGAARGG